MRYNSREAIPNMGVTAMDARVECDWCSAFVLGDHAPDDWEVIPPTPGDSLLGIASSPGGHKCPACIKASAEREVLSAAKMYPYGSELELTKDVRCVYSGGGLSATPERPIRVQTSMRGVNLRDGTAYLEWVGFTFGVKLLELFTGGVMEVDPDDPSKLTELKLAPKE